jgi:hypothetical protein
MNVRVILTVPSKDPSALSPNTEIYNVKFTAGN